MNRPLSSEKQGNLNKSKTVLAFCKALASSVSPVSGISSLYPSSVRETIFLRVRVDERARSPSLDCVLRKAVGQRINGS